MLQNEPTIIGISPGSRYLGIAVLKGSELREWRIKVIRAKTEAERLAHVRTVLLGLLNRYQPTFVALKAVHGSRGSPLLHRVVDLLRSSAREHGIVLNEYSLESLKAALTQGKLRSKLAMSKELAVMYPVLHQALPHLADSKTFYYMKVFEAVAAGKVCALRYFSAPRIAEIV